MDDYCFIILRHVNNEKANIYWSHCYDQIRIYYSNVKIIIIDDNSKYKPIKLGDKLDNNTQIINSEFPPQRGEFLPYYYFYKKRFAKRAVIIHDTVFLHKKIKRYQIYTEKYYFLWDFKHNWDNDPEILGIIDQFNDSKELKEFYLSKEKWKGCFGAMSIINLNYLSSIFNKSNYLDVLVKNINSRERRMAFERLVALLLTYYDNDKSSVNGNIQQNLKWGINYNSYINKKYKEKMEKVWLGRGEPFDISYIYFFLNRIKYYFFVVIILLLLFHIFYTKYL
tara:strand:- start:7770 stop:8612 length:843 start_codon:yes stop_codon:yes gene_type:complete